MRIRRATPSDVEAFMAFKSLYPMPNEAEASRRGFLMGSSREDYLRFVAHDYCLVLDHQGQVAGFSIVLGHGTLRESPVWRHLLSASLAGISPAFLEEMKPCFFEQLVVAPSPEAKVHGKNLGVGALKMAFVHHGFALTTVVTSPVRNLASPRLVRASGFRPVGTITEDYPHLQNVTSDVYAMHKWEFEANKYNVNPQIEDWQG